MPSPADVLLTAQAAWAFLGSLVVALLYVTRRLVRAGRYVAGRMADIADTADSVRDLTATFSTYVADIEQRLGHVERRIAQLESAVNRGRPSIGG